MNWITDILKHLYKNYSFASLSMNDFLISKFGLSSTSLQNIKDINNLLGTLRDEGYITYGQKPINDKVCHLGDDYSNPENGRLPGDLAHITLYAKLTLKGYHYIENVLTEERQDRQLRLQSKIAWGTLFVAIAGAIASVSSIVIEASEETDTELKTLNTQYKNTQPLLLKMQQSQRGIDSSLRLIADSLGR